jgi:hypothetical protein
MTELQSLLNCIQEWCIERGMTISEWTNKTEIVVLSTMADLLLRLGTWWSIGGEHIKAQPMFGRYLGVLCHFSSGAQYGLQRAAQRGRPACGVPAP